MSSCVCCHFSCLDFAVASIALERIRASDPNRLEIKHLEESRRRALCCASCDRGVAWEGDVFTLPGAEGVVGAYVNPTGYVHQVLSLFLSSTAPTG